MPECTPKELLCIGQHFALLLPRMMGDGALLSINNLQKLCKDVLPIMLLVEKVVDFYYCSEIAL